MDKAIKQLIDQMRKDTQENIRRIMREAARQARGDFEREAKHYIDKYYSECDPWPDYKRTYTLRDYGYSPYTLWNKNKVQAGVRFTDRDADFSSRYGRDINHDDGWGTGIGGIVMSNFMIGSHGRPELSGTVNGDPVGERMEDFERLYAYKMDAYFTSQGLTRII